MANTLKTKKIHTISMHKKNKKYTFFIKNRLYLLHNMYAYIYVYTVNETCRNLQAKVIKTAAFCHNRALQDLFPDSYRLLFTTGSFTSITSPFSNEPGVQRVQRERMEG